VSALFLVAMAEPDAALGLMAAARIAGEAVKPVRTDVLVVRRPPASLILAGEEVMAAEQFVLIREQEAARAAKIAWIYQSWVADAEAGGDSAQYSWIDTEGIPDEEVARRADKADLIVIGRPSPESDGSLHQICRAALFDSHRPVLVIPPGFSADFGRRIAIAWKDDGRAMKAIIPALRHFPNPDELSVIVGHRGDHAGEAPEAVRLRAPNAKLVSVPTGSAPFGQILLASASQLGADLLVMGAYAHSPLREMLLGGTTRYVLAHAEIPVLLRH